MLLWRHLPKLPLNITENFVMLQSYSFGQLRLHAKFQNRSLTPYMLLFG
jgi:hypothetical protein